ncbi:MAG: alpha/beta hydrolase [Gemmatimonadetes bacterium]|nr:alpha/beta hydrolase [Gemmatimonadota bacterium]
MIVHTALGAVGLDESGRGVPVLWLHGFPHDRSVWAPQLASPAPGFRYLAPDLPGFGESVQLPDPSLDAWADWIATLLDTLAIDRAVIAGLSMGGYLALAFWRRHPGRVLALVLADTRAGADSEETRSKRRERQGLVRAEGPGVIADLMIPGMVGQTTRAERPAVVATIHAVMQRASVAGIVDGLQALMDRDDSTATLATVTVPTLVLCGEEDVLTPVADSQLIAAGIAGSRLALMPGVGHVSNIEAPEVFNALLSDFLAATIRTDKT